MHDTLISTALFYRVGKDDPRCVYERNAAGDYRLFAECPTPADATKIAAALNPSVMSDRIESLEATIVSQASTIEDLDNQLSEARSELKDAKGERDEAVKELEGSDSVLAAMDAGHGDET